MQDKEDNRWDKWDNYTSMELAEMWFDSVGLPNRRTKLDWGDKEWVLIVTFEHEGTPLDIILHKQELEDKADEWVYENE